MTPPERSIEVTMTPPGRSIEVIKAQLAAAESWREHANTAGNIQWVQVHRRRHTGSAMTREAMCELLQTVTSAVQGSSWLAPREYGRLCRLLEQLRTDPDLPPRAHDQVIAVSQWLGILVDEAEVLAQGGPNEVRKSLLAAAGTLARTLQAS